MKKERTNWLEFKFEMDGIPEKEIREVLIGSRGKTKILSIAEWITPLIGD